MIWFSSIVLKDTSTLLQGPRFKPDMRACVCVCVCAYARDREWRVEQRGDSRLLKNWWVARGHVSPKVISCCDTHPPRWLPVINIITSCSGEEAKVGAFFTCASVGCARTRYAWIRKMGNVFLWRAWEDFMELCSELFMLKSAFSCS